MLRPAGLGSGLWEPPSACGGESGELGLRVWGVGVPGIRGSTFYINTSLNADVTL